MKGSLFGIVPIFLTGTSLATTVLQEGCEISPDTGDVNLTLGVVDTGYCQTLHGNSSWLLDCSTQTLVNYAGANCSGVPTEVTTVGTCSGQEYETTGQNSTNTTLFCSEVLQSYVQAVVYPTNTDCSTEGLEGNPPVYASSLDQCNKFENWYYTITKGDNNTITINVYQSAGCQGDPWYTKDAVFGECTAAEQYGVSAVFTWKAGPGYAIGSDEEDDVNATAGIDYCASYGGEPHLHMINFTIDGGNSSENSSEIVTQHCTGSGDRDFAVSEGWSVIVRQKYLEQRKSRKALSLIDKITFESDNGSVVFDESANWTEGTFGPFTVSLLDGGDPVQVGGEEFQTHAVVSGDNFTAVITRFVWDASQSGSNSSDEEGDDDSGSKISQLYTITMCSNAVQSGILLEGCDADDQVTAVERGQSSPCKLKGCAKKQVKYDIWDECAQLSEPFRTDCNIDVTLTGGNLAYVDATWQSQQDFEDLLAVNLTDFTTTSAPTLEYETPTNETTVSPSSEYEGTSVTPTIEGGITSSPTPAEGTTESPSESGGVTVAPSGSGDVTVAPSGSGEVTVAPSGNGDVTVAPSGNGDVTAAPSGGV